MTEIIISVLILAVVVVLHYYLWRKLVYKISFTNTIWFKLGSLITVFSWMLTTLALVSGPHGAPIAAFDSLAVIGLRWLIIFIIGVILFFVIDMIQLFGGCKYNLLPQEGNKVLQKGNRLNRKSKKIIAFLIIAMIGVVFSMYGNESTGERDTSGLSVTGSLPFTGRWLVGFTPEQRIPSHGTDMFGVGYAIDFIAVNEQNRTSSSVSWRTFLGTEPPEIFYAFGMSVYSPVSGRVVRTHNGEPDQEARRSFLALIPYALGQASRIRRGPTAIAGNYVIITPDNSDVYIAIVHLQLDSIIVEEGQYVMEGEHIANCGNSGNSTQPHIHIQAMTSTDFSITQGVPLYFNEFFQWNKGESEPQILRNSFPGGGSVVSPK